MHELRFRGAGLAVLAVLGMLAVAVPGAIGDQKSGPDQQEIALFPEASANHINQPLKLTAFVVEREEGESFVGQSVTVLVISGPNAGKSMTETSDDNGAAHFSYTSGAAGTDILQASYPDVDDARAACSNLVAATWVPLGQPLPKPPPPAPTPPPPSTAPPTSGGPTAGAQPGNCRAPALIKVPGATGFQPVQEGQALPPGTLVNASGEASLTIQKPTGQAMTFFGVPDNVPSEFVITAAPAGGAGLIGIALVGGSFNVCKKPSSSSRYLAGLSAAAKAKPGPKRPKPIRRLWGSGKGTYTTSGKYASATVRGTNWLVADYCNGTLITVRSGVIRIRDFITKKFKTIHSGQNYFAYAPGQHP